MQKATVVRTQRRTLRPPLSMSGFRFEHLAGLTILMTYGLIVLGGAVRATDSGTACPDWPLCHGQVIPRLEGHVLVEYSHRLVASIVGLLIFGTAVWAWRRNREDPLIVGLSALAIVFLVALHLSIALTLLATLIVLALAAARPRKDSAASLPVIPIMVALGAFALVISGAYVSQEGAGLAYKDWPLFDGKLVSSGGWLGDLHYAHRLLAGGLGVLMLVLTISTFRHEQRAAVTLAVALALAVYVAQVLVGAANIWFELATPLRISHLALASALWAVLVFAAAWSYLAPYPEE